MVIYHPDQFDSAFPFGYFQALRPALYQSGAQDVQYCKGYSWAKSQVVVN